MNYQPRLTSTREFLNVLQNNNNLRIIEDEIDPNLELGQFHREVFKRNGPALLFTNVKGTQFPVATNLYGSTQRLDLAFGDQPTQLIKDLTETLNNIFPPRVKKLWNAKHLLPKILKVGLTQKQRGPVMENCMTSPDLTKLPQVKSWPEDGGAFLTLPLVYTESPVSGKGNLGMYRIQLFDSTTAGMHIQINRGGGYHFHEAEQQNQALPVRVMLGGPPALTIAAVAPLPEDIPELMFASLLCGKKLQTGIPDELGISLAFEADFSIQGYIQPKYRKAEGPFGDHYGYYSLKHDYPYFKVHSIYHRKNAVYPATFVGRPPQEDHYIAEYLQDILKPLYPMVMPNVKDIWAYEESGVHTLAAAVVKERYPKEAFTASLRILSEGQLSLNKFLLVTDQECNIKNFRETIITVLERADLKEDLHILADTSQDTLDYTGPAVNRGSKAIIIGTGDKIRNLKDVWDGSLHHSGYSNARLFCPGVLCIEGCSYQFKPDLAEELIKEPAIQDYSMVILTDDVQSTCRSNEDFIWHVFTRFEPAADIYGKKEIKRFHIGVDGPMIIDCRFKPWYPPVLEEDEAVQKRVLEKWGTRIDQMCM